MEDCEISGSPRLTFLQQSFHRLFWMLTEALSLDLILVSLHAYEKTAGRLWILQIGNRGSERESDFPKNTQQAWQSQDSDPGLCDAGACAGLGHNGSCWLMGRV